MSSITFDSYDLQDINGTGVIVSNIVYRNIPTRNVETEKITRRPGVRVLNDEFAERKIKIEGSIFGTSIQDLQNKIDALHSNVTRKTSGNLVINGDRSATALVTSANIPDNPYNTDYVPFSMEMMLPDPFFYGPQQTLTLALASGTNTHNLSITVSGSYYMYPQFTLTMPGSAGDTPTSRVDILYGSTGEYVTWSGASGNTTLDYGDTLQFDFNEQTIIRTLTTQNSAGVFAAFDPGSRNVTVTFSGGTFVGGTLGIVYLPRYL